MYADVVLPDCTFMERDEGINTSYKKHLFLLLGSIVKPLSLCMILKVGIGLSCNWLNGRLNLRFFEQYFGEFEREGIMSLWKKQYSKITGLMMLSLQRYLH